MKKPLIAFTLVLSCLFACDDTTGEIGSDIMPTSDNVLSTNASYRVVSRSVRSDSVLANTSTCYLGSLVDPSTNARTDCSFMAQFHVLENFGFPSQELIVTDEGGQPVADSCEIRLYYSQCYGDSLATMKLRVRELDASNPMLEGQNYYSNIKTEDYVSPSPQVDKTQAYTPYDAADPSTQESTSSYASVRIKLPTEYATYLMRQYYENPANYANSYDFIRKVCPGFLFEHAGGTGALLRVEISVLNVYFSYHEQTREGNDTIVVGLQRLAATEEVLQNTSVTNFYPEALLDVSNPYTMVMSPAEIYTEVELPVAEITAGEHYKDTINSASIAFRHYNVSSSSSSSADEAVVGAPSSLLMLPKSEMYTFFEQGKLPDNITSFLTDNADNAYTFTNIARLIQSLRLQRDDGAGVKENDNESVRAAKYAAWDTAHPGWNTVVLLPVESQYVTTTTSYGTSTRTLVRLRPYLGLSAVRIEGGATAAPLINIIYSRFK